MAAMRSIGRLYQAPAPQPEREQGKINNLLNSEPDMLLAFQRSLAAPRRRFARRREEVGTAYGFDGPAAIMSIVHPGVPVDRSSDFQALAASLNFRGKA
jgi:hypothetical protein